MSFNPQPTGPVASEEGKEGKQAVLLLDLAGPLSPHLNWIYSSIQMCKVAAKAAWGKLVNQHLISSMLHVQQ